MKDYRVYAENFDVALGTASAIIATGFELAPGSINSWQAEDFEAGYPIIVTKGMNENRVLISIYKK